MLLAETGSTRVELSRVESSLGSRAETDRVRIRDWRAQGVCIETYFWLSVGISVGISVRWIHCSRML